MKTKAEFEAERKKYEELIESLVEENKNLLMHLKGFKDVG